MFSRLLLRNCLSFDQYMVDSKFYKFFPDNYLAAQADHRFDVEFQSSFLVKLSFFEDAYRPICELCNIFTKSCNKQG